MRRDVDKYGLRDPTGLESAVPNIKGKTKIDSTKFWPRSANYFIPETFSLGH